MDSITNTRCGDQEKNISPIDVQSVDSVGDDTQLRFRYQHTVTALIALLMYLGDLPYKEILCEYHEDILALSENEKYTGIQIKTKDPKLGLFDLSDKSVISALAKFCKLNAQFDNQFEKYIFATNCNFLEDNTGKSIARLADELKRDKINNEAFTPKTLEEYVQKIQDKANCSRECVISTLKKTKFQIMPSINEIDSVIISKTLSQIPECTELPVERLSFILNSIVTTVYSKSSRKSNDTIMYYIALLAGDVDENFRIAEVNSKLIRPDDIEIMITAPEMNAFLGLNVETVDDNPERSEIMEMKMNCGAISQTSIANMNTLRENSEQFFLKEFYKSQSSVDSQRKYTHIKNVVKNESIEAHEQVEKDDKPYGKEMMKEIEGRLKQISSETPDKVLGCKYEVLKGLVGSLTGECKVQFSPTPKGGWIKDG